MGGPSKMAESTPASSAAICLHISITGYSSCALCLGLQLAAQDSSHPCGQEIAKAPTGVHGDVAHIIPSSSAAQLQIFVKPA